MGRGLKTSTFGMSRPARRLPSSFRSLLMAGNLSGAMMSLSVPAMLLARFTFTMAQRFRKVGFHPPFFFGGFPRCLSPSLITGIQSRLQLQGLGQFELSPGSAPYKVAVFVPEIKGAPAFVRIFLYGSWQSPISNKAFYKAEKIQMIWNKNGTKVLVLTSTEVDSTGKSYFGETGLYFLDSAGKVDCRVALDKEGPIHDICWSPNSKEFIVVYGCKDRPRVEGLPYLLLTGPLPPF